MNISCHAYGNSYHLLCQNIGNQSITITGVWEGRPEYEKFPESLNRQEVNPLDDDVLPITLAKHTSTKFLIVGTYQNRSKPFQGCLTVKYRRIDKDYCVKKPHSINF
ncbi:MAG: hypothetical protein OXC92_00015 [Flavobacteriaceae bacterium]|nr:hypothetical protein [Flavobacteriaceae bacterium]MCY4253460.1 hypothetical protein [Flavobacteriaceae bacterium]